MLEPQLEPDPPFPHSTISYTGLRPASPDSTTMYNRSFYDHRVYVWLFPNRREVSVSLYALPVVQLEATIWLETYKTHEEADALVRKAVSLVSTTPLSDLVKMKAVGA